jgi:uncharacterized protein (DUF362 family)
MSKKEKPIQKPDYEKAPMDRRTFIRRAAAVGGITAGMGYLSFAPEDKPLSRKDVTGKRSVIEPKKFTLTDYRVAKPEGMVQDIGIAWGRGERQANGHFSDEQKRNMLRESIDAIGGIKHYIKKGDVVMVKPNVAFDRSPNLGATSNPEMLNQLVRLILEDGGASEVRVADNPIESPPDCFRKSKIDAAATDAGGRIYMPDDNAFRMLNTPGAALIEEWWFFARPFMGVDKVIGFSPVKDHNLCHASMSLKNWYGLLGGTRNQFHQDIHGIVSDLAIMMRPTMSIIDGTNVMMQNGPTGGDPSNVKAGDVVIAGLDGVAMDTWAYEFCLERGKDYPAYLQKAQEKGGGNMDWKGRLKEVESTIALG